MRLLDRFARNIAVGFLLLPETYRAWRIVSPWAKSGVSEAASVDARLGFALTGADTEGRMEAWAVGTAGGG